MPVIYAAAKASRIKPNEIRKHIGKIREIIELEKENAILLFSAKTKTGKDDLWKNINGLLRR